ncbi:bifunctional riboflavin kinase/FAD synthetase [Microbacterium capsulatum]|uniref:Riboflavin biosynthesis protein n=1 Tax=Microbacterium capsulatum TaxID=3041921 RepID=A0ABU0XFC0_9MICO|nr:bifunctional riboflavin kinase/FAD synthetase [Microbacterium sp. ASV81]MDQ4212390.1 bifunctional riboflavin kinase/FAD synthetase [Microbacterium sp. ASV81]
MIVFRDPSEVPADFGRTVAAIGKFDGVHAGHRAVFRKAALDAAELGARTVAVTFDRNPLSILRPDHCPDALVSVDRKIELLSECGLDAVLVLTFDEQLAARTAEDFVRSILVDALHVAAVLVGRDFRFGRGGAGTPGLLRELGAQDDFVVDVIEDVFLTGTDRRMSSSWVRELLAAGDVALAGTVLGRPVSVRGEVVHGHKRGRELGFPTANLPAMLDEFVPADGVYAGRMIDHTTGLTHPAAVSVGTNPTFDDVLERQVEAHAIDRPGLDLYGHDVTVEFTHRLRGMTAFDSIEALIAGIASDVAQARILLGIEEPDTARSNAQ